MTHNQIQFAQHLENARHNVEQERILVRGQDVQERVGLASAAATRYAADQSLAATKYSSDNSLKASQYQADTTAGWQGDKTTQSYVDSLLRAGSWFIPFVVGRKTSGGGSGPNLSTPGKGVAAPQPKAAQQKSTERGTAQIPGQIGMPGWDVVANAQTEMANFANAFTPTNYAVAVQGFPSTKEFLSDAAPALGIALAVAGTGALIAGTSGAAAPILIPLFGG